MEVFKNVGGISYVSNIAELHDCNIRKYQASFGLSVDSTRPKKDKSGGGRGGGGVSAAVPASEPGDADWAASPLGGDGSDNGCVDNSTA
jgi:hypothetical protein